MEALTKAIFIYVCTFYNLLRCIVFGFFQPFSSADVGSLKTLSLLRVTKFAFVIALLIISFFLFTLQNVFGHLKKLTTFQPSPCLHVKQHNFQTSCRINRPIKTFFQIFPKRHVHFHRLLSDLTYRECIVKKNMMT